jgi:hypothetical protein
MMGQRKLTGFEVDKIAVLLNDLDKAAELIGCNDARQYFPDAVGMLASMKTNGTTDGKPWIEPQPEIGDGYRRATEADVGRKDIEYFSELQGGVWARRAKVNSSLLSNYTYRVPVDRIPTDEDARQRPTVMVRDRESQPWYKTALVAVSNGDEKPFFEKSFSKVDCWRECRFPYPGELD